MRGEDVLEGCGVEGCEVEISMVLIAKEGRMERFHTSQ